MKIGLVLGAGGVTGGAYLAGALTALEHDLGWDPREADVIVGTSAGALTGALLRRGVPASDLSAWTVGARVSDGGAPVLGAFEHPQFDALSLRQFLRPPRLPHPMAVWSALRRPWRVDPLRALMTHLADGSQSIEPSLAFLGREWPSREFACCAVRRKNGTRRVFRSDRDLARAVSASCAVPGFFAPVEIDGELYIDGGVASPTNADILRYHDLDLVIALSPMSSSGAVAHHSFQGLARARAGRQLRQELGVLRRHGIATVVLAPGFEVLEHISADFMSDEHSNDIVAAAFLETGRQLRGLVPTVADSLRHVRVRAQTA
jgi:NTE family protein